MAGRSDGDIPVDMWQNMSRMDDNVMEEIGMWEVAALILALFVLLVAGALTVAIFFFVLDKLSAYTREGER